MNDKLNLPSSPAPNNLIRKATNTLDYQRPSAERRFEISYGMDKFYLTQAERNAFLTAIRNGSDSVQVGEMTLSRFFKYIMPVENPKPETAPEDQKLINLAKENQQK